MPEKSYRIDGNLLTNEMVTVEAFRMVDDDTDGETGSDVNMKFMLEDSNILRGKFIWRPTMMMELNVISRQLFIFAFKSCVINNLNRNPFSQSKTPHRNNTTR